MKATNRNISLSLQSTECAHNIGYSRWTARHSRLCTSVLQIAAHIIDQNYMICCGIWAMIQLWSIV